MSKKKDSYYFENFVTCVEYSSRAARMLEENLIHFRRENLKDRLDEIHRVEHDANQKKHEMMGVLVKAFITPIEREDIILLSQSIDEVTDKIEDVMIRLYINNVKDIRPEAVEFAALLIQCCEALSQMMQEFENFRRSKIIKEKIIRINDLEEQGDRLYREAIRALYTQQTTAEEKLVWTTLFDCCERCCDACEHTSEAVEAAMMNNT